MKKQLKLKHNSSINQRFFKNSETTKALPNLKAVERMEADSGRKTETNSGRGVKRTNERHDEMNQR